MISQLVISMLCYIDYVSVHFRKWKVLNSVKLRFRFYILIKNMVLFGCEIDVLGFHWNIKASCLHPRWLEIFVPRNIQLHQSDIANSIESILCHFWECVRFASRSSESESFFIFRCAAMHTHTHTLTRAGV